MPTMRYQRYIENFSQSRIPYLYDRYHENGERLVQIARLLYIAGCRAACQRRSLSPVLRQEAYLCHLLAKTPNCG